MNITCFAVGPLSTNCYFLVCEKTGESVVIDPGGINNSMLAAINSTVLKAVLLTHGHFDHTLETETIAGKTGAPVMIHKSDIGLMTDPILNGSSMIGIRHTLDVIPVAIADGDVVCFGDSSLRVLHTPGHTPGGVSFLGEGCIFGGDTLFRMSVGRWDLPGGDYEVLMKTLHTVFLPLDDATVVYPGHGPETTIGFERRHNSFLSL